MEVFSLIELRSNSKGFLTQLTKYKLSLSSAYSDILYAANIILQDIILSTVTICIGIDLLSGCKKVVTASLIREVRHYFFMRNRIMILAARRMLISLRKTRVYVL